MNLLASPLLWLVVAFYFLFNKKGGSKFGQSGNPYVTPLPGGSVVNPDGTSTIFPTITPVKAQSIALQLREELGNFITSDTVVLSLFRGLNQADFVMISNEFRIMTRDVLTPSEGGFLGTGRDLVWWLIDELSSSSLSQLKKQFPTIF